MDLYKIFSFYVLPIGNILGFLATLILLVLTYKYLKFTKVMANIMNEEFKIRIAPKVEIEAMHFHSHNLIYSPQFAISNKGSYNVIFVSYKIKFWHTEFENMAVSQEEKIFNRIIGLGDNYPFTAYADLSELTKLPVKGKEHNILIIETTFNFLDSTAKEFKKTDRYKSDWGRL